MNKVRCFLFAASLGLFFTSSLPAQDMTSSAGIPKVLQIQREFLKPGKSGMAHVKSESAFIQALTKAKWPTHYIALTSLSGKPRALFLTSYASFADWEKDGAAFQKNATLSAAIDHAYSVDGELVDSFDQGIFVLNENMSLRPRPDLSAMRFMEISMYHVKPGHGKEWEEAVKLVKAAYEKGVPDSHWGMFEEHYGGDGGIYLILTSHKTLSEIDEGFANDKKFAAAMGEDGMKRLSELVASCVESSQHQLFAFSGEMSYVQDEWIKADPTFWKPKMSAATPAKAPTGDKKTKM